MGKSGKGQGQEQLVPDKTSAKQKYEPAYDKLAFQVMSKKPFQSKSHLCVALHCSKPTLLIWLKTYPSFKSAFDKGLEIGAKLTREKIADHAFSPSSQVNNGLIKLLAANVYGIKEEPSTVVNVNQNNTTVVDEQTLKDRGLPVPDVSSDDIPDD